MENNKRLKVVIPFLKEDIAEDLKLSVESIPWEYYISIDIYTDNIERVHNILDKIDMGSSADPDGDVEIIIYELPGNRNTLKNLSISKSTEKYIMFLNPGDEITDLDCYCLDDDFKILIGNTVGEYYRKEDIACLGPLISNGIMPISTNGFIFSLDYLHENKEIRFTNNSSNSSGFISKLIESLLLTYGDDFLFKPSDLILEGYLEISSRSNLLINEEISIINELVDLWDLHVKGPKFSTKLREYIWERISRSAASICKLSEGKLDSVIGDYYKYLYKDNIDNILKVNCSSDSYLD